MNVYRFEIGVQGKKIIFDSEVNGLIIDSVLYQSGEDGILVYDKISGSSSDEVICQFSTNTSTLIPALKVLGIQYNPYFNNREVIESQNDITFYWNPSRLAAFYNRFSTDGVEFEKREPIIRKAVEFLIETSTSGEEFLPIETLKEIEEDCILLGFYQGFPIFDAGKGLSKLKSRIGIHIGLESIMVSTPMDRYENDVFEVAQVLEEKSGIKGVKRKNRVRFEKDDKLLSELSINQ